MSQRYRRWCVPILVGIGAAQPVKQQTSPCDVFREILEAVPHVALTRQFGSFESTWDGEPPASCEITFETNEATLNGSTVPDFLADPGTRMYRDEWRMIPEILADGPGTGVHGIQKGGARCVIRWEQPVYIDDDGNFVESDRRTTVIQCSDGPPGE